MLTSKAAPQRRRRALGLGAALAAAALFAGACGDNSEAATGTQPLASPTVAAQPLAVKDMWVKTARSGMSAVFGTLMNTGEWRPASVAPLPAFAIDRLQDRWSGGDLLIQICADDPMTLTHAQRMLVKDTLAFAKPRWTQRGFRNSRGMRDDGVTQRNVLGQLDGTRNPALGTPVFDGAVWVDNGPAWLHGGSTVVVRRIHAEMETWDAVDSVGKEFAVGRTLDTGAPLTGTRETDPPDYTATNRLGLAVISESAHIARAHVDDDRQRIFRRPYNYDEGPGPDGRSDMGLIFAAFQRDVDEQFLPIQRNLAELDLLNDWITPIGSAVFAVPPGCQPGGWIGETLLS